MAASNFHENYFYDHVTFHEHPENFSPRNLEVLQGRIQELKGGGAEVKYLQRENSTLRHSHFGVIWL